MLNIRLLCALCFVRCDHNALHRFANLTDREVARLVGTLEKIVFSEGDPIIVEGETEAEM